MRLLAEENIPAEAVEALRRDGHDVRWVRTEIPGSKDDNVLALALLEERVLLTFDKDFGELAFKFGLSARCGVVLLRFAPASPHAAANTILAALKARDDWSGHFSVIELDRIRMTELPRET